MQLSDISVPSVYTDESSDFRFFLNWFIQSLDHVKYDTDHFFDLYDPQRCPAKLLWMLADTMGYKYDDRLPTSFNREVLLYFMSMIRNRGSKDGVTLAAEVNLKQFDINEVAGEGYEDSEGNFVEPNPILYNRLEDTSIPVNSVYVEPHVEKGYIDVVYFSDRKPIDACIEYVRPLGMYLFPHVGVRLDGRTKLSIDARLTDDRDIGMSIGPTHVGHYSREDYARLQKIDEDTDVENMTEQSYSGNIKDQEHRVWLDKDHTVRETKGNLSHTRRNVWYRNSDYEGQSEPIQGPNRNIHPGYRALYSLQLCNNEHIVKSLVPYKPGTDEQLHPGDDYQGADMREPDKIFGLGWKPQDVETTYPDDYKLPDIEHDWYGYQAYNNTHGQLSRAWNLRYDKDREESLGSDVSTIDNNRTKDILTPRPAVNPIQHKIGDAMNLKDDNTQYMLQDDSEDHTLRMYNVHSDGARGTELTDEERKKHTKD